MHKGVLYSDVVVGRYEAHKDALAVDEPFLGPLDRIWKWIKKFLSKGNRFPS